MRTRSATCIRAWTWRATTESTLPGPVSIRALKALIWVGGFLPLARTGWQAIFGGLGANPIEEVIHRMGWWGLVFLVLTLAVTPIRKLTGWNRLIRVRRLLGLFAFFYLTLHFASYFGLDQFFALGYIAEDILERPFILVGFLGWLLLVPLAITSTRGWIRKLGKRWVKLHRLVYVSAGLGVLHYYWKVKADTREPLVFAAILAALLLFRAWNARSRLAGAAARRAVRKDSRTAAPPSPGEVRR